jgi:SAM-dependent methyltransferase
MRVISQGQSLANDDAEFDKKMNKRWSMFEFLKQKQRPLWAQYVLDKFLQMSPRGDFLEIGCGNGAHSEYVYKSGVFDSLTCIDLGHGHQSASHIAGDFEKFEFDRQFDAIWCSHVLEHTRNPGLFLDKLNAVLKEGGILALNIPPAKDDITTGHLTIWNGGLLLLNMIRGGFDCSDVKIKVQGYNIGLILRKKSCGPSYIFEPDVSGSDRQYLPAGLKWRQKKSNKVWYFQGNFRSLNWD